MKNSKPPEYEDDRAMRETLEHLASMGELAAGLVHETRNILTGVLGLAQVGAGRTADPEAEKLLRTIERESQRCVQMFASYLRFARSHREVPAPMDVGECIERAAVLLAHQLRLSRCNLQVEVEPSTPSIIGCAGELQQVLMNLVLNGAQACKEGGSVHVRSRGTDDGHVEITVSDSGPGVPEALRERIFEPLFSTKPPGLGTGLGLSVSRRITEANGGSLTVQQAEGGGAAFCIRLPIVPPQVESQP